ncbi:hypothetical protein AAVH_03729 [Aphelenchoides avenae]|nr:hypothetical protein AAVH_03729 [Aphelenchus avenae]
MRPKLNPVAQALPQKVSTMSAGEQIQLMRMIAGQDYPKASGWPFLRRNIRRVQKKHEECGGQRRVGTVKSIPQKGYGRRQFFQHAKGARLEPAVISLKREMARRCKFADALSPEGPLSTTAYKSYDGDSATFEFFCVSAPLLAGNREAHIDLYACIVNKSGVIVSNDLITSFVCGVNNKYPSVVYEYWIPRYKDGYDEVLVVARGEIVEASPDAQELHSETAIGNLKTSMVKPAKNAEPTAAKSKKAKPALVSNRQKQVTVKSDRSTAKSIRKIEKKHGPNRRHAADSNITPVVKSKRSRPMAADKTSTEAADENKRVLRVRGVKSLGTWKEKDELDIRYSSSGMTLFEDVSSTSPTKVGSSKRTKSEPTTELIKELQIEKKNHRRGFADMFLKMEVSNEHGYSDYLEPPKPKPTQDDARPGLSSPMRDRSRLEIRYVLQNGEQHTTSKELSPLSEGSSSSSSGYGTNSSASALDDQPSSSSGKRNTTRSLHNGTQNGVEPLLPSSMLARIPGSPLFHCCICPRTFDSMDRLQNHLDLSYAHFFEFRYEESERRIYIRQLSQTPANRRDTFINIRKLPSKSKGVAVVMPSLNTEPDETESGERKRRSLPCPEAFVFKLEDLDIGTLPFAGPSYKELKNPPVPNLYGVDADQSWIRTDVERRIKEFTDVTPSEQKFCALLSSFMVQRENRLLGYSQTVQTMKRFAEVHRETIIRERLLLQWVSHCVALERNGFISPEDFKSLALLFKEDRPKAKTRVPRKKPKVFGF